MPYNDSIINIHLKGSFLLAKFPKAYGIPRLDSYGNEYYRFISTQSLGYYMHVYTFIKGETSAKIQVSEFHKSRFKSELNGKINEFYTVSLDNNQ